MTLTKKGDYSYGTSAKDIQTEMAEFSEDNGYPAVRYAQSVCACGNRSFNLESDEDAGVAQRTCAECGVVHFMGDSAEFADDADLGGHVCVCGEDVFELMSGVALYPDSNDVRWYYIGCRCAGCDLVGVFAEWKCEAGNADAFLAKV